MRARSRLLMQASWLQNRCAWQSCSDAWAVRAGPRTEKPSVVHCTNHSERYSEMEAQSGSHSLDFSYLALRRAGWGSPVTWPVREAMHLCARVWAVEEGGARDRRREKTPPSQGNGGEGASRAP